MAARRPTRAQESEHPLEPRVGADLPEVVLDGWDAESYDEVALSGSAAHDRRAPVSIMGCRITGLDLVGASLAGTRLIDVVVEGGDLAGADLEGATFTRVLFHGARLTGAQMSVGRWRDVRFVECVLDRVNMRGVRAERVRFEGSRLREADLASSEFDAVAWWDCDLTDADVSQITVRRAQLHGSDIDGLRGVMGLRPIAIDAEQEPVVAARLLSELGVVVEDRRDA